MPVAMDGPGKEAFVRGVFTAIARRYDMLNSILSFNRDKYWRRFAVARTGLQPGDRALDVCCGTGMLTLELARTVGPGGAVTGIDFCPEMLARARENIARAACGGAITLVEGNALNLPFDDDAFDCVTVGFALRNVADIPRALAEMRRVVRPGGRVVSLELAKPGAPVFKQLYYLYFEHLLPWLGSLGVGRSGPYQWLPESLRRYPHQRVVRDMFLQAGLKDAVYYELTGGIVAVHVGTK